MLTGKALGAAIAKAIELKGVSKVEVARAFEVKPPSIQDWIKRGTISKAKLPQLWDYFRDVAGPEHWGLQSIPPRGAVAAPPALPGPRFSELTTEERRLVEAWRHLLAADRRAKLKELVELAGEREAQRQELFEEYGITGIAQRAAATATRASRTSVRVTGPDDGDDGL